MTGDNVTDREDQVRSIIKKWWSEDYLSQLHDESLTKLVGYIMELDEERMSDVRFRKHRVFRETDSVIFYDISVEESNASDLVVHTGPAISPPDDGVGAKQFYIHSFQDDFNRVVSGTRTFELVNFDWRFPYHVVHLDVHSGALYIPRHTYHRSVSGDEGSIVINQAQRFEGFDAGKEFIPTSAAEDPELYKVLLHEKPVIHRLGE